MQEIINKTIDNEFNLPVNNNNYLGLKNNIIVFLDDFWDCSKLVKHNLQGLSKNSYTVNFSKIKDEKIKIIIKQYTWYVIATSNSKIQTLMNNINNHFIGNSYKFMKLKKIDSLSSVNNKFLLELICYLQEEHSHSLSYLANIINNFINICNLSYKKKWINSTDVIIGLGCNPFTYLKVKKYIENKKNGDKSIDDLTFNKIMLAVKSEDIYKQHYRTEKYDIIKNGLCKGLRNPNLSKFGIIIQAYTGLRISEILTLEEDCISIENNKYWLIYTSTKTEYEPIKRKILIHKSVYEYIQILIDITKNFRDLLSKMDDLHSNNIKKFIFLKWCYHTKKISTAKSSSWTGSILKNFIKRSKITYTSNNKYTFYPLKSHQFRHTFAKKLVENNVPLRVIKKHYSHVSIDMTMHYIHLKEKRVQEDYIKTFVTSNNIYTNGNNGDRFKTLVENISITDNIEDEITNLSKRFGINPLPMGLCILDYKKGHCIHTGSEGCYFSGCQDFVTNNNFLQIFKKQIKIIDKEIERIKSNNFSKMTLEINLKKKEKLEKIINDIETKGIYLESENKNE